MNESTAATNEDEPLTLDRLILFSELIKPQFYFEPLEIELHDPIETIMLPYHRFSPTFDHRSILSGTVAMPDDLPKRKRSAKEIYKADQQIKRLLKRYWALKVGEVLLRMIEKKLSL